MLATAKATGRNFNIQVRNIFDMETKAAKLLIDGGNISTHSITRSTGFRRRGRPYVDGYGTPTFVQKQNSAGGALYDMGVYHISTLLFL